MISAFEVFSDRWGFLGESPVWSEDGSCLWWVDTEGCRLLRTDAASGRTEVWDAPEAVGCITMRPDGMLLAGLASGIFSSIRQMVVSIRPARQKAAGMFASTTAPSIRRAASGQAPCTWSSPNPREPFSASKPILHTAVFSMACGRRTDSPSIRFVAACISRILIPPCKPSGFATMTSSQECQAIAASLRRRMISPAGRTARSSMRMASTGSPALVDRSFSASRRQAKALEPIPFPVTHPTKIVMDGANPRSVFVTTRRTVPEEETHASGHVLRATLS